MHTCRRFKLLREKSLSEVVNVKRLAPETAIDQLVHLACALMDTKIGLVAVIGDTDLLFRSIVGLENASVPADISVTRKMVEMGTGAILDVPNAASDPRFADHPWVTGPQAVRSYAGATISNSVGVPIGSIAVMDTKPREPISASQRASLARVARLAGEIYDQTKDRRDQREQLEMLRLAEKMGGLGHWRLEPTLGKLSWSEEAFRIHGVQPTDEPLSLEAIMRLYHPDDQLVMGQLIGDGIKDGDTYRLRVVRPDGETRTVQASARSETDDAGGIAIFGVIQDITERETERDALLKSEANYRLLADNIGDVVARLRLSGRIEYISPAATKLTGWLPKEMIGKSFKSFVPPDAWCEFRALMARRAKGDDGYRLQHRVTKKCGEIAWVESDCQMVAPSDGGLPEIILTIRDISERRLLEDGLIAARERAEAADQAKSEFLANMTHELRTPLTSVIGFSDVLLKSPSLTDSDRRYARRIATASDVLLGVVNDILDFSKLEADAVEVEVAVFDPRALAEGAASIIETQCESRGVAMVLDVAPDLPELLVGDTIKLRQVMLNFLSNAVKFTSEGEIRLSVGGQPATVGAWDLQVSVSDTGVGIPPEKMDQMFDRFTQADVSTTRVYGGTGLGLAICRRLVELMGGSIGVEARPEGGSTFWFRASLSTACLHSPSTVQTGELLPEGMRVLLADDAAPNRELVTIILQSLGIEIDAVSDGLQAVEALRTGSYDLVLMDVHMPVMDGLQATRAIRASAEAWASTPIIALTANIEPEQVVRCLEAGMFGLVGKPIQVGELVRVMAKAISEPLPGPARLAVG